ncbi:prolipoprotein diacylglyceryl transferase [Cereibacter johrii]|uniref:Phosphatidylglycerol--prolipoprotein diacylglyceryl transferase n=1 Tax=Cereibacter johrii TaxID=445629 RepID=A0ABX5J331_9RHOB|nr:prolipoprotein diacylglyceryl transferase [Cereibacter johrii]ODM41475.1 prolipoprotein diacylglyceryl transferase [Cereibacter johrii]PTM74996.1 prolipoprotein diacylglyceryl transferase [Cereibacter johrii]
MSYIPFPDISPELFSIELFGMTFALRWYALAYIAGLVIGWRLVLRMIRAERLWTFGPPMTEDQLERLLSWVILGVILGGRLGFVLFYQPAHYLTHPLDILKVWEGGMSFHGGFLGVMTALVAFCLKERISILPVADLLAAATPPGLFLGRIANFINAELWGRPTTLPWGVAFPGEAAQNCPGIEGICARHPSQLYEAGLEGILLFTVLSLLVWRRGWLHWPGSVSGMFLAGYGATRFLVEFVRQPDAQFVSAGNPLGLAWQISGYGLTMGQILSLPMILLGLYLVLRSRRAA